MPIFPILLILVAIGLGLTIINRFIPMAGSIRTVLNFVVVIAVVLWLLNIFGILHFSHGLHMGR